MQLNKPALPSAPGAVSEQAGRPVLGVLRSSAAHRNASARAPRSASLLGTGGR